MKFSVYKILKTCFYTLLGILVIIFHTQIMSDQKNIALLVGSVMYIYALEGIIEASLKAKKVYFGQHMGTYVLLIFLGTLMFFFLHDEEHVVVSCILWGVWSILREGEELNEALQSAHKRLPFVLNAIESVVVIYFSTIMIYDAVNQEELLHHAKVHVILLGIELICKAILPIYSKLFAKYVLKRSAEEE